MVIKCPNWKLYSLSSLNNISLLVDKTISLYLGKGHLYFICFYIFDTNVDFFIVWTIYFVLLWYKLLCHLLNPFPCSLKFFSFLIRLTFWFTWLPSKWLRMTSLLEDKLKSAQRDWKQSCEIKIFYAAVQLYNCIIVMFIASNTKKYWPLQILWHFNDDRFFLISLNECFYIALCA